MDLNSSVLEIARLAEVPSELFKSTTFSAGMFGSLQLDLTQSLSSSDADSSSNIDDDDFDVTGELELSLPDSLNRSKLSSLEMGGSGGVSVGEVLRMMVTSEKKLAELRLRDRYSLSLVDQILLRFNEVTVPLQKDLEEARSSLDITRKELNLALFNVNSQSSELSRLRNTTTSEIERFKTEYEDIRCVHEHLVCTHLNSLHKIPKSEMTFMVHTTHAPHSRPHHTLHILSFFFT